MTIEDGSIVFKGEVDFSPTYKVTAGDPPGFLPPKEAQVGAFADWAQR